jgi:hypothetical protein
MDNRAEAIGPREYVVHDVDQAWTVCVIEHIFGLDPNADAWCNKMHLLDKSLKLSAEPSLLVPACSLLLGELSSVCCRARRIDELRGSLRLRNVTAHFANMIRKALMTRVPVWCATEVVIEKNTSRFPSCSRSSYV